MQHAKQWLAGSIVTLLAVLSGNSAQASPVLARTHSHALIQHENFGQPFVELFDLKKDPWQTRNIAGEADSAATLGSLKQAIAEWEESTDHAAMIPIGNNPGRTRRSAPQSPAPAGGRKSR